MPDESPSDPNTPPVPPTVEMPAAEASPPPLVENPTLIESVPPPNPSEESTPEIIPTPEPSVPTSPEETPPIPQPSPVTTSSPVQSPAMSSSPLLSAADLPARGLAARRARLQEKLTEILTLAAKEEFITNDMVEKQLHVSDKTATRYLGTLVKNGKLQRIGSTSHARYVVPK